MQHRLFGSGLDLDSMSDFKFDLSMSNYTPFAAARREETGVIVVILLPLWSRKLLLENMSAPNCSS